MPAMRPSRHLIGSFYNDPPGRPGPGSAARTMPGLMRRPLGRDDNGPGAHSRERRAGNDGRAASPGREGTVMRWAAVGTAGPAAASRYLLPFERNLVSTRQHPAVL